MKELKAILFVITQQCFEKYLSQIFCRSCHLKVFCQKDVLKIWSIFTGEHPRSSVVSIKLLCNFIEITLGHRCFPVHFLYHIRILLLRTPLDDCFEFWEIRKKHQWWSLILIDWQTETLLKFNFTDE